MKNILAIGPHPDDIEIGCFGALTKFSKDRDKITFLILSNGSKKSGNREEEAKESAKLINANLIIENLEDGNIINNDKTINLLKKYIDKIKPNIIFVPYKKDRHQDHKNVADSVLDVIKDIKSVYFYETPSSIEFSPNFFIDITEFVDLKIKAILCHKSQIKDEDIIREGIDCVSKAYGFKLKQYGRKFEGFRIEG